MFKLASLLGLTASISGCVETSLDAADTSVRATCRATWHVCSTRLFIMVKLGGLGDRIKADQARLRTGSFYSVDNHIDYLEVRVRNTDC